jgi:hypothetical protein
VGKKSGKPKGTRNPRKSTYRILARQPLSIEIGPGSCVENLSIQGVSCRIDIRSAHSEEALQRELGGSLLAIEFEGDDDTDLFVVARNGFELIEDFLSAITVISGTTFHPSTILQAARLTSAKKTCDFLQFLQLPVNHWHEVISEPMIRSARHLLAHWDGLESGKRLRRAARRYRDAAGTLDDVAAFQEAYIGLEAMEPPLAKMAGLTAGTEEVKGSCEHCGHEFIRKRTSLVGVRAFVLGGTKPESADEQRKADWRLINNLRNDLMHGLVDDATLKRRPHDALITSMHYLHDAIMICSHAAAGPSQNYRLARGATRFVLIGTYTATSWSALRDWAEIVETSSFRWVPHTTHGLVPEMAFRNQGLKGLRVGFGRVVEPMSVATMNDLRNAPIEMDAGTSSGS